MKRLNTYGLSNEHGFWFILNFSTPFVRHWYGANVHASTLQREAQCADAAARAFQTLLEAAGALV